MKNVNANLALAIISVVLVIGIVVMAILGVNIPSIITQLTTLVFGGLFGYAVQPTKTNTSIPNNSSSTNIVKGS